MNAVDKPVYLDYAATTPVDPRVAKTIAEVMSADGDFANPAALHSAGQRSARRVEQAAEQLALLLNVNPERIVWTSGATESNNLAIIGAARYRRRRGRHLISMRTEHKAVTDVMQALEMDGFDVTWLAPDDQGLLSPDALRSALREDTQLVSIMHTNNETGVIQDIDALGEICRARDVLLHVDAAQALGKSPIDLTESPVDLLSVTAHKLYGPTGIGALFIADRPACHIEALMFGGGQQRRLRPGTLPVALIAGFGHAAQIATQQLHDDRRHLKALRARLWDGIRQVPDLQLNTPLQHSYPGLLNVSVADVEGESLLLALEPLCVATGSACNAQNAEPSSVLKALGRSDREAQGAIRFSLGRPTTTADIDLAIDIYQQAVQRLRRLSPGRAA